MRFLLTTLLSAGLLAAQAAPPGYHSPHTYYTARHQPYRRPPVRLTIGGNLAYYNGDLTNRVRDNNLRLGLGLGLTHPLSPRVTFGVELAYIKLEAKDYFPERGLRFSSTNGLLTTFVRYNLLADKNMYTGMAHHTTPLLVFLQAGVGATLYNPTASVNTPSGFVDIGPEGRTTYPGVAGVLPVGGGITLRASRALHFTVEGLYYFTTTDLLDGVSQRANPKTTDDFATLNLKIEYAFYKKKGKPLVHFD